MNGAFGVAVDTANGSNMLVADYYNNRVDVFSTTGGIIGTIGDAGGEGQLSSLKIFVTRAGRTALRS